MELTLTDGRIHSFEVQDHTFLKECVMPLRWGPICVNHDMFLSILKAYEIMTRFQVLMLKFFFIYDVRY